MPAAPAPAPADRARTTLLRWVLLFYWPAMAVGTHWPELDLTLPELPDLRFDKPVHFAAFALLTVLLRYAAPAGRGARAATHLLTAGMLAAAYALVDEFTQRFVPGRTVSLADLVTNLVAVASSVVAIGMSELRWRHEQVRVWACRVALCVLLPAAAVLAFGPAMNLESVRVVSFPGLGLTADKVAHLLGGMLLLWLLSGAAPLGVGRKWFNFVLALVVMAAAAPAVEYVQLLCGRNYEVADIAAHLIGLGLGALLQLALYATLFLTRPRRGAPPRWTALPVPAAETGQGSAAGETPGERPVNGSTGTSPRRRSTSFVGHAAVVSALTLLSRFTGLARDAYLTSAFGLTGIADAFWFGFAMPNLFRRLFGEGALTAAFVPVYTDLLARQRELARRFTSLCVGLTLVVLGALTLAGELLLAALLARGDWSADASLAIRLTMIMLPYMPLVCLVALFGAVLQVHGRFAPSAGMPVFLNLVMIGGAAYATWGVRADNPSGLRVAATVLAVFVLVAGAVQVVTQLYLMLRHETLTATLAGTAVHFRSFWRAFLPTFLALSVFQINTFLDQMLAMGLSPKVGGPAMLSVMGWTMDFPIDAGGLAALNCAQRLYQFPLGVFGIAIATAIFPALARAAAEPGLDGQQHFRRILQQGLRLTVFIGLPASVGLILVGLPITRLLFERGQFHLEDSRRVTFVLIGYAPAIWAYSMTHVLTRAFYAIRDARTPMVISVLMVILNLALNLTLVWPLGAAGLAWSTAVCAIIQCGLLVMIVRQYVPTPIDRGVLIGWGRTVTLCIAMAAAIVPLLMGFDPAELSLRAVAAQAVGLVAAGMLVFAAGAWLTRSEELAWLTRRASGEPRP